MTGTNIIIGDTPIFSLNHDYVVGFLRGGCSRGGGNWGTPKDS